VTDKAVGMRLSEVQGWGVKLDGSLGSFGLFGRGGRGDSRRLSSVVFFWLMEVKGRGMETIEGQRSGARQRKGEGGVGTSRRSSWTDMVRETDRDRETERVTERQLESVCE